MKSKNNPGCALLALGYSAAFTILLLITFAVCLASCSRVTYVEVPTITHDTIHHTNIRIDSIHDRDSIYIESFRLGDTVMLTKYVERWRTKHLTIHDTLYIHRTDTITIPRPVERQLTKWQTYCLQLGNTVSIMLLLAILYALYRIYKKVRGIIKKS